MDVIIVLVLKNAENKTCDVCGNEAVSKLEDSQEELKKNIGLALCSQCLEKLYKNIQKR